MFVGITSTSAASPAATRSRSALMTAKTYATLCPLCASNLGVSAPKISFGAPPLKTLIVAIVPSPRRLQFKTLQRPRMEKLLRLHQPRRQSLRMVMAQEDLERLAARRDAIRPEVVAHELACFAQPLLDKRQGHLGR